MRFIFFIFITLCSASVLAQFSNNIGVSRTYVVNNNSSSMVEITGGGYKALQPNYQTNFTYTFSNRIIESSSYRCRESDRETIICSNGGRHPVLFRVKGYCKVVEEREDVGFITCEDAFGPDNKLKKLELSDSTIQRNNSNFGQFVYEWIYNKFNDSPMIEFSHYKDTNQAILLLSKGIQRYCSNLRGKYEFDREKSSFKCLNSNSDLIGLITAQRMGDSIYISYDMPNKSEFESSRQ